MLCAALPMSTELAFLLQWQPLNNRCVSEQMPAMTALLPQPFQHKKIEPTKTSSRICNQRCRRNAHNIAYEYAASHTQWPQLVLLPLHFVNQRPRPHPHEAAGVRKLHMPTLPMMPRKIAGQRRSRSEGPSLHSPSRNAVSCELPHNTPHGYE